MKVFLGGTCGSTWRDELIPKLDIFYFNPIVDVWTEESQAEEIRQRTLCDIILYVLTPKMSGVYSIAEVVDDSNKHPMKTILTVLRSDSGERFDDDQIASLNSVMDMVKKNGAKIFTDLSDTIIELNSRTSNKKE